MITDNIRINIRNARILRQVTGKQAAQLLGISQAAYCKLENGKSNFSTAQVWAFCEAFCMQPNDFFSNPFIYPHNF
jgi:DNA-binding XRE family transcriptional regulator